MGTYTDAVQVRGYARETGFGIDTFNLSDDDLETLILVAEEDTDSLLGPLLREPINGRKYPLPESCRSTPAARCQERPRRRPCGGCRRVRGSCNPTTDPGRWSTADSRSIPARTPGLPAPASPEGAVGARLDHQERLRGPGAALMADGELPIDTRVHVNARKYEAPYVLLRRRLEECRAQGMEFGPAWKWSLRHIRYPVETAAAQAWRRSSPSSASPGDAPSSWKCPRPPKRSSCTSSIMSPPSLTTTPRAPTRPHGRLEPVPEPVPGRRERGLRKSAFLVVVVRSCAQVVAVPLELASRVLVAVAAVDEWR